ncbi:hypothetical protein BZZ08_07260 [Streptomyces sp. MH60]|nr:hypothetical protein BZZ08_07260 [Streptomyces sp. MH60]
MGEFDGAVVEGEQPGGDQPVQHGAGAVPVAEVEFRVLGGAPGVGGAVARGDQPQQDPAREVGLRRGEFAVHLLGGADDGAAQSSGRLVAGDGQGPAGAVPPGLQQRVRHQRQSARRVLDLVEQPGGQGAFDDQGGRGGRPDDGLPQFLAAHRTGQQGGVLQRGGEPGVFGAAPEEVGADGDHDAQPAAGTGGGQEPVDEGVPLGRVGAEGVQLLELVDDQPGVGVRAGHGVEPVRVGGQRGRAGGEDADGGGGGGCVGAGCGRAQAGDQTGPQQGGLAAARGAEDGGEAVPAGQSLQAVHQPVAAEEQGGVVRFVAGQTAVGRAGLLVGGRECGGLRARRPPAPLPLLRVAAAHVDVGEGHREGGQLPSGGRLRQGGHRERDLVGHRPVRRPPHRFAQGAEFGGEPLYRSGRGVQPPFPASHSLSAHVRPAPAVALGPRPGAHGREARARAASAGLLVGGWRTGSSRCLHGGSAWFRSVPRGPPHCSVPGAGC